MGDEPSTDVPFTSQEETERDAEDTQFLAGTDFRPEALVQVDTLAGEARKKWAAASPLQSAVYARKADLAREWDAEVSPNPLDPKYAMLKAEADGLGVTVDALVLEILTKAAAWEAAAGAIEGVRRKAKADIDVAADRAGIEAVLSALVYPAPV